MSENMVIKPFLVLVAIVAAVFAAVLLPVLLLGGRQARAQEASNAQASTSASATATPPSVSPATPEGQMEQRFQTQVLPFLKANCYQCHANGKHRGDVTLDKFTSFASIQADRDTWQSVQDMLQEHKMPPKKAPQPPAQQLEMALRFASDALNFVDTSLPPDPGFVAIHRLNRNEYDNTIRDLVGVDFHPSEDFPLDDTGYGFDNIADVLSMSPLLAEKYLAAAEQIMDKAIDTNAANASRQAHYSAKQLAGGRLLSDDQHRLLHKKGRITHDYQAGTEGEYEIRIVASGDQAGDEPVHMKLFVDEKEVEKFDVSNPRKDPQPFKTKQKLEQGEHKISIEFSNPSSAKNDLNPNQKDRNLIVSGLEVEGPLGLAHSEPSEIQKRLLFCGPAEGAEGEKYARQIIAKFAGRAYRRPPTEQEINGLLKLYRASRADGDSFEQSCKLSLTAALVSPQFLYRIEIDPPDSTVPHTLNDYELASRLSYFLWSSMPDDQLLQLASQNKLHQRDVLNEQVKRMLADSKSQAFTSNFAGQWLELRNLKQATPDPKKFPQFDAELRDAMRQEGERFFANLVKEDRGMLELLDANYTFLNQRLASFYGIDGVSGEDFQKVQLSDAQAKHRGGILTMAGVLTVTALPNRTSPVKRGKFIMDQILGTPPPPPPPGVPPLSDKPGDVHAASLRERLEQHRKDPNCAVCHDKLDPLGFSLENFDAIGRWRDKDGDFDIDSRGKLPTGEDLDGPDGLKHVLLSHKQQFLKCLTGKMMTYALGRGVDGHDAPVIGHIISEAAKNDYRFSSVIYGIVNSDEFLKRRAKLPTDQRVAQGQASENPKRSNP